jgi:hypothetical protein
MKTKKNVTRKHRLSRRQIWGKQLKLQLHYALPHSISLISKQTIHNYTNYALPRHWIQKLENEYNTGKWPFKIPDLKNKQNYAYRNPWPLTRPAIAGSRDSTGQRRTISKQNFYKPNPD